MHPVLEATSSRSDVGAPVFQVAPNVFVIGFQDERNIERYGNHNANSPSASPRVSPQQVESVSGWCAECRHVIETFGALEPGWDSYDAEPPNATAIQKALAIVNYLSRVDFRPSVVSPVADGGVGITFRNRDRLASIEIDNDGEILVLTEEGRGTPEVRSLGFDLSECKKTLLILKRFVRHASRTVEG